jgi:hypothetical protein
MDYSFINTKTNLQKLQFGREKCFKMQVGKDYQDGVCPDLKVDGWDIKSVDQIETKEIIMEDEHTGLHEMETVDKEKYLGDIISNDGKNTKNIAARKNRGTGIVNQIMSILEDICFGKHHFKVAMVLRGALLISSLLTNSEAWYNLSTAEIEELERVDESLMRRVLECPSSTPKEMLYLELGVSPIRSIIKSRRINFLQYILKEDKSSLIYKFLKAQLNQPTKNDWGEVVLKDISEFDINLSLKDIENMSGITFKSLVEKKEKEYTIKYLNTVKQGHSKVLHINHSVLEMADYIQPNGIINSEARFLFMVRSRMLDVRKNFEGKHSNTLCPLCEVEADTQQHLLVCEELEVSGAIVDSPPEYENLFASGLDEKLSISRILKEKFKIRKLKLEK